MLEVLKADEVQNLRLKDWADFDDCVMISEMKVSIARLSILTSTLGIGFNGEQEAARARVISDIGNLAARSARLVKQDLRLQTAQRLSLFRKGMIGVLDGLATLKDATARRDAAVADASAFADKVVSQLGNISREAATGFETAAANTADAIWRALGQKLFLTVILVAVISFFAWRVVERDLIRRLSRLANHVRNLAAGNIEVPVPTTSPDEVGEIEQAVERSRRMALALRQSNDELERFAYVAAHDLRSPLRAVSDLVSWTREDYGDDLPKGAQSNLDVIEGCMSRLSNDLSALLDYARAGQTDATPSVFDLEDFADDMRAVYLHDARFSLEVTGNARQFETFATPVKTILLNLVSNALKHHDQDHGKIEIASIADGNFVEIRVRDDGPGIAPEYHQKVFMLFQTLRARDDVESTGLGLALVEKLAVSLGGTIAVSSEPAQRRGTEFVLRLPVGQAARSTRLEPSDLGGLAA